MARQVGADPAEAQWRITVNGDKPGEIVWNGITRRRSTTAQSRHIQTRQRTCVFPGCRMPAQQRDLDHTIDYAHGGVIRVENLAPLCRHDHHLKHEGGWNLTQQDHAYAWTIPLGNNYVTQPQGP